VSAGGDGVGLGSGFFVAKGGYILTNYHVVEGSVRIKILTAAQKTIDARVVKSSKVPDLALLIADIQEHPVLKLANSDEVETGAHVAAIGSPKGYQQSFTPGAISSTERDYMGNKCFQMSVLINHGNSGGPLLDEMGRVVGINTFGEGTAAVLRNGVKIGSDVQGINFAVKINEALGLLQENIPGFSKR
jgi:serine protease Do